MAVKSNHVLREVAILLWAWAVAKFQSCLRLHGKQRWATIATWTLGNTHMPAPGYAFLMPVLIQYFSHLFSFLHSTQPGPLLNLPWYPSNCKCLGKLDSTLKAALELDIPTCLRQAGKSPYPTPGCLREPTPPSRTACAAHIPVPHVNVKKIYIYICPVPLINNAAQIYSPELGAPSVSHTQDKMISRLPGPSNRCFF